MLANEGHSDWITVSVLLSRSAADVVTRAANISITQYRVLISLYMTPEGMKVSEIAEGLDLSASTITISLNKLEQMKAVTRFYDQKDRRVVHVKITDVGKELIAKVDPGIKEVAHDFWSCYSSEELELTYKDSGSTASQHHLEYVKDGAMSIENAYIDASWVIISALEKLMKRANISLNEYRVLYLLYENEDGMRPSDISRRLLLRSNEVAVAASKLEKHGRIRRERSGEDRRSCKLFITEQGLDKLERITPGVVEAFKNKITKLRVGTFEQYDSIAKKVLAQNYSRHLITI